MLLSEVFLLAQLLEQVCYSCFLLIITLSNAEPAEIPRSYPEGARKCSSVLVEGFALVFYAETSFHCTSVILQLDFFS